MLDTKGCRGQLMNIAQRLLSIDSPSGFTDQVVREAEQIARDHGYAVRRTNKGNLVVSVPGREKGKRVGLCAHIDTLGLMVRGVLPHPHQGRPDIHRNHPVSVPGGPRL